MSKAEDLSKELYPLLKTDKIGNNPYISYNMEQLAKQEGFIKGYHQAENDLELGWEDISIIRQIMFNYNSTIRNGMAIPNDVEYCQEVLKRFKERKEIKRN